VDLDLDFGVDLDVDEKGRSVKNAVDVSSTSPTAVQVHVDV
jgi:hypothetical protein